ncbi:YKOF-related Family [Alteromonadaceae bacterium Bs31]|nr:YKOF-related Family [Alteromonadaceae bacterium Bs31]
MKLSVELSYYPLQQQDHIAAILKVIEKINSFEGLQVNTFPTATIVVGDYGEVMAMLNTLVAWTYEQFGRSIFVAKFIPDYVAN